MTTSDKLTPVYKSTNVQYSGSYKNVPAKDIFCYPDVTKLELTYLLNERDKLLAILQDGYDDCWACHTNINERIKPMPWVLAAAEVLGKQNNPMNESK